MPRSRWLLVLVVAALAAAAYLWLRPDGASSPETSASAPALDRAAGPARSGASARPSAAPSGTGPASPAAPGPATAVEDASATQGIVEGRVLSFGTGQGVPGAELTFARASAVVTRSGADGSFVFKPHEPGTWLLASASAPGFLPFAPEWGHSPVAVTAVPGRRVRGVTVYLTPAIDYVGTVVDLQGKPVSGAEVRVLGARTGENVLIPLQERYTSDAKGEFRFHAPDSAVLEARKPPLAPGRASLDFSAQVSHRLTIKLGAATGDEAQAQRQTISGRALDDRGSPIEGAVVLAETELDPANPKAETASSAEATTDTDGRFWLEGLDPGAYKVSASHAGLAPAMVRNVAAGTRELTLRLTGGGSLRGAVSDAESGRPITAFVVNLWRRPDSLRVERVAGRAVVEPSGTYQVDGLPLERLRASVTAPGYAASPELDVEIAAGSPAVANFALKRGARLTGTVLDRSTHQPIEGARATVEARWALGSASSAVPARPTSLSDAQGSFELAGLAPGPLSITVAASGHHGRIVSGLEAPESGDMPAVTVELTPTEEGEQPKLELAGIGVTLAPRGDGLMIGQVFPGGGAEASGLLPGDLLLAVDGKAVKDLGYEGTVMAIRGPEGTSVTLLVHRADGSEVSITVPRRIVRA